jgi:hypothetical protein
MTKTLNLKLTHGIVENVAVNMDIAATLADIAA